MKKLLHVIHIEDSQEDSELIRHMLQAANIRCEIQRVETRDQFVKALQQSKCDLVLSDCSLPHFDGLEALQIAHGMKPEAPFIFVSGTIGEEQPSNRCKTEPPTTCSSTACPGSFPPSVVP